MDRRDFIKNSLIFCGCSCLAYGGKVFYDFKQENYIDGVKLEKSYLIEKYKDKSELPRRIKLESSTLCQLNCPGCNMRKFPELVEKGCGSGYLSFENFKKFVDDNNFEEIELTNNGEMFLNPELLEIIKYAHKKNINLTDRVGVNLNYIKDAVAEALVKYKFEGLIVSIDGASQETYAQYRKGGDFNAVIANIKKINGYKKQYNSQYPEITYKFILFGHNEHEIDKAKALAKKLNMKMSFVSNCDPAISPVKNPELVKQKTGVDTTLTINETLAKNYKKNNSEWFFCKQLWQTPQINWDGKVLGCCFVFGSDFGGNAFKEGLLNALNHPKMIYAKNMVANAPFVKPLKSIPCSQCPNYKLMNDMKFTVKPKQRGEHLSI